MHRTIFLLLVLAMCSLTAQAQITRAGVRVHRISRVSLPSRQVTNQVPLNVPRQRTQKALPLAPTATLPPVAVTPTAGPASSVRPVANRPHSRYEAPPTPMPQPVAPVVVQQPVPAPVRTVSAPPQPKPAPVVVKTPPVALQPAAPTVVKAVPQQPVAAAAPVVKAPPVAPQPVPQSVPAARKAPTPAKVTPAPVQTPQRRRRLPIAPVPDGSTALPPVPENLIAEPSARR